MNKLIILIFCFNLALTLSAQNFVRTSVSNKNVLLESFTGVNCFYCAGADAAAAAVQNAHPDSVIWINIHAGIFAEPGGNRPDFRSPYADTLLSFSGLTVFPAAMINRRLLPDFAQNTGKLAIESFNWSTVTDTILIETSPVNIAARSEFNISTRMLKVVVESYYTGNSINSQNRLFAALLLDSRFTLVLMVLGDDRSLAPLRSHPAIAAGRAVFREPVGVTEVASALNDYDLELIFFPPRFANNTFALPNKFFEAIQGRLGVVIGQSPEIVGFVRQHGFGIIVDGWTGKDLALALNALTPEKIAEMKNAANRAAKDFSTLGEGPRFLAEVGA
jgi:hypothetical protein